MAKISGKLKEYLRNHLAFVATADLKGRPNVVPKGNLAVLDEGTIVFADLYNHQTKKNLLVNPNIAITVVNPAGYTGYQLKGKAKIIGRGLEYDKLVKLLGQDGQLSHPDAKYAVKANVTKIIDIGYGEFADKEIR
ncbi:MAG: pyridoxamine 5'-phosphate oxidase family protein [Candidatus Omnitrophota bacterium]